MLHASLTWENRFLDSRFRGNDGPGQASQLYHCIIHCIIVHRTGKEEP